MAHLMINENHIKAIENSGLFDKEWYLNEYPDVALSGLDPIVHYYKYGASLGRNPGPEFDSKFYLASNPDVQSAGVNPLLHYTQFGQKENREIKPSSALTNSVSMFNDSTGVYTDFDLSREAEFLQEIASRFSALATSSLPLVSVVMPTWNRGDRIQKAIESVLEQNYPKFEILVCDDGSRDDTARIVAAMAKKDPRIRYFLLSHQGVSAARNHGLSNAEGGLIAYLDSDNTWRPSFLSTMVTYMMTEKLDCAYSGMRISGLKYRGQSFDREALLSRNYIDLNTFVHRRSLAINRGGFDESLRRMVDWDLIFRYTKDSVTEYAAFVGVEYDDRWGRDRITSTESGAWEHVVRSKLLIDWNEIKQGLQARRKARLSIVISVGEQSSAGELAQAIENWRAEIGAKVRDLEFVLVSSANELQTRTLLEARTPDNILLVDVPARANLAFRFNRGVATSSGSVIVLTQPNVIPSAEWGDSIGQMLDHKLDASVLYAQYVKDDCGEASVRQGSVLRDVHHSIEETHDRYCLLASTAEDYVFAQGLEAGCADNLVFSELIERGKELGWEAIWLDGFSQAVVDTEHIVARALAEQNQEHSLPNFVDPFDERVRRQLRALAEGKAEDLVAFQAPGLTGAWHFTTPYTVSGWCMDLSNPGAPVSVTLTSDGHPIATIVANQKTIARETGLSLVVPIGFRFDLSEIEGMKGEQRLNVLPTNGGLLLPGQARTVQLPESGANPELLVTIDEKANSGDLASAYLLARRAVFDGVYGVAERFLVLDFALRQDWHCYPDFLASVTGIVRPQLAGTVQHLYEINVLGTAYTNSVAPPISGLPKKYIELLSDYPRNRSSKLEEQIEQAALWHTLDAIPRNLSIERDYAAIEIVLAYPEQKEPSVVASQWQSLSELGCRIVRLEDKSNGYHTARWQLRMSEPRYIGVGSIGYLAGLLDSGAQVRHSVSVLDVHDSFASMDLIARATDTVVSTQALERVHHITTISDSSAVRIECRGYKIADETPWQKARNSCLVFHDLPHDASLQPLPRGAVTVSMRQSSDASSVDLASGGTGYPLLQIAKYLEAHQVPDETVVFVLLEAFKYPTGYVEDFVRKSVANGNRSVVLVPVAYQRTEAEFRVSLASGGDVSYLGMLPLGGYTVHDIKESLNQFSNYASYVVAATRLPFIVEGSADAEHASNNALKANRLLGGSYANSAEHNKGFVSDVRAHWYGAAETFDQVRIGGSWEGLAELDRVAAAQPGTPLKLDKFPTELLRKAATTGQELVAQTYLRRYMEDPETPKRMSEEDLSGVVDMCKFLGCQEDFARVFSHNAPALIKRFPNHIIPIFEMFAISLPPGDLNAIVLAIAPMILQASAKRIVFRLVDMCRKYCSARTLFLLIGMIEQSSHKELLTSSNLSREIGEALFSAQLDPDEFKYVPNIQFYLSHAPLLPRIVDAVIRHQRDDFVQLIKIYFAEQHEPQALLRTLRIYSSEISQLGLSSGEIPYPAKIARMDLLGLAILFGDTDIVRKYVPVQQDTESSIIDDVGIVAASYDRNNHLIQAAFERWGDVHDVATMPFIGESIHSLFEGFANQAPLPPVSGESGRVSAIVTVYNPDLDLMRLAVVSLLKQTYDDVEVIVVDDGSDLVDSKAIEDIALLDSRIKFIRMVKNSGPYVCRNRALEIATGEFIAIQDGDDYAHPQRFEKQVAAFLQDPLLRLCTASHVRVDSMARFQFEHSLELRGDGTMTSMFRRDVFNALGGFAQVRSRGDVEFRERLKASYGKHTYTHIDYPLLYCFATAASLSNRTARNNLAFLSLFRDAFGKRMRVPVINDRQLCATTPVVVPYPLRPEC
ncbi:hypothetical protein BOTU111922_22745 [Bordetella tumulicola]